MNKLSIAYQRQSDSCHRNEQLQMTSLCINGTSGSPRYSLVLCQQQNSLPSVQVAGPVDNDLVTSGFLRKLKRNPANLKTPKILNCGYFHKQGAKTQVGRIRRSRSHMLLEHLKCWFNKWLFVQRKHFRSVSAIVYGNIYKKTNK